MRASIAVRRSEGSWAGVRASEPSTAPLLILPSGLSATDAAGGRLRRTLSATTLNAAKGSPCAAAIAAAICDSVSTAAAPVTRCNSRLTAGSVTGASTPARSAVQDAVRRPLKALSVGLRGVRTEGAMAREISLKHQRPAQYVFSRHVEEKLAEVRIGKTGAKESTAA